MKRGFNKKLEVELDLNAQTFDLSEPCEEKSQKRELVIRQVSDPEDDCNIQALCHILTFPNKQLCREWHDILSAILSKKAASQAQSQISVD